MLIDRKDRRYLVDLETDGQFHSHAGFVAHNEVAGLPDGSLINSTRGATYIVLRPTLSDYILKMPRGAQVIYPKDIGPILMLSDMFAGARVVESGLGSGALSTALLRAGANITGYEIREDFLARARKNVVRFLGEDVMANYTTSVHDIYEGIETSDADRVILDLPEPWRVVPHAEQALRPGGIFVAYTPSITQATQLREALDNSAFAMAETLEVLNRSWHIAGAAVRPDHRMVAHTAFLTHARLLAR